MRSITNGGLLYAEHYESHAASAFYPSPFREAAFLMMDGVCEWATTSFGVDRRADIETLNEIQYARIYGKLRLLPLVWVFSGVAPARLAPTLSLLQWSGRAPRPA